MACRDKTQSAIQETRDQLFLDTADGVHLNVVTSNLGLDRPFEGIEDDEWRALAKQVGLSFKEVRNIFYRLLEICVGPQKTRVAYLAGASAIGDDVVVLTDASPLVQVGTLVFDPGLPTEETVDFCFRDLASNKVFLSDSLTIAHSPVATALNYLAADTAAGATSLVLRSTALFPTSGFPYAALIDQGLPTEEVVRVTANNTGTNTLTLFAATTQDHVGARPLGFVVRPITLATVVGGVFLLFGASQTRVFPATGFVRINAGAVNEEVIQFIANDPSTGVLSLKTPLKHTHASSPAEYVELVTPGSVVQTVSVLQKGVPWEVLESQPHSVKICLPPQTLIRRLVDASYIHAASAPAFSTAVIVPTSPTDTTITVDDVSGLPFPTGTIIVGGTTTIQYLTYDSSTSIVTLAEAIGSSFPIGATVVLDPQPYSGTDLEEGNLRTSGGTINTAPEWSGPYLYDVLQNAPSLVRTTLARSGGAIVAIPPPTRVVVSQTVGRTCLEVDDAYQWPTPSYPVRIGRDTGFQEDMTLLAVNLRINGQSTLNTGASIGDFSITLVDSTAFPDSSDSIHDAGYQVIIDQGGSHQEVVLVKDNTDAAPGTLTLVSTTPLTKNHSSGETVQLLNDVLTFDPLTQPHTGDSINPSRFGHPVEKLTSSLLTASTTGFPSAGSLWLNFGTNRLSVRKKITVVVSSTVLQFDDSSVFPTGNFAYPVLVGEGLITQEWAHVSANNTTLNQLTLSAPLVGTFAAGDYVALRAGAPTVLSYTTHDSTTFTLEEPTILDTAYTVGESVIWSPGSSLPGSTGTDYPFRMPSSPIQCFMGLIDLIRAAGVQVTVLDSCLQIEPGAAAPPPPAPVYLLGSWAAGASFGGNTTETEIGMSRAFDFDTILAAGATTFTARLTGNVATAGAGTVWRLRYVTDLSLPLSSSPVGATFNLTTTGLFSLSVTLTPPSGVLGLLLTFQDNSSATSVTEAVLLIEVQ